MTQRALSAPPKTPILVFREGKPAGMPLDWERFFAVLTAELVKVKSYSLTISPGSISAHSTKTAVAACPGVAVGQVVSLNRQGAVAGVGVGNAWVSAADEVTVEFFNATAGAIDPGAQLIYLTAI